MALKLIVLASFALTGAMFYLSKNENATRPAKSIAVEPPVIIQARRAAEPKKKKDIKLAQADMPVIESYASLMPTGEIITVTPKPKNPDFVASTVRPTMQSCYKDLVKRREEIWEARDGDAELSFEGEVELTAVFHEGQLNFVQSRSSEVRDEKFHNCLETGMKQWKFPQAVTSQPEWNYRQRIAYDVNYNYDCKESIVVSERAVGIKKCN